MNIKRALALAVSVATVTVAVARRPQRRRRLALTPVGITTNAGLTRRGARRHAELRVRAAQVQPFAPEVAAAAGPRGEGLGLT